MIQVVDGKVFSKLSFSSENQMLNVIRSMQDRFEIYDVDWDKFTFWILCGDVK